MKIAKTSNVKSVKTLIDLIIEHQEEMFVTVTHDDLCLWLDEIERLMTLVANATKD